MGENFINNHIKLLQGVKMYKVDTVDSIEYIYQRDWEELVGRDIAEYDYRWYKVNEKFDKNLNPKYITVYKGNKLVGSAFISIQNKLDISIRKSHLTFPLLGKISFFRCSSPISNFSGFFFNKEEVLKIIMKKIEEILKQNRAVLSNFVIGQNNILSNFLESRGFYRIKCKPNTFLDIKWKTFDEYLSSLPKSERHDIRKTINRSKKYGISIEYKKNFSSMSKKLCELYGNVAGKHRERSMPENFFKVLDREMGDNTDLFLCKKEDKVIAYGLSLNNTAVASHKFLGLDYGHRKSQAYFLLYYEGIKKAINDGLKRIYFGSTTYRYKERIGCKRFENFQYIRSYFPGMNKFLPYAIKITNKGV